MRDHRLRRCRWQPPEDDVVDGDGAGPDDDDGQRQRLPPPKIAGDVRPDRKPVG